MASRSRGETPSNLRIIVGDSLPTAPFVRPAGAVSMNTRPPNKRLKLAGGYRCIKEAERCALARTHYRSDTQRAAGESPAA